MEVGDHGVSGEIAVALLVLVPIGTVGLVWVVGFVVPSLAIKIGVVPARIRLSQYEKNYVDQVYRLLPGDPAHYGSAMNEMQIIQDGYEAGLSPTEFVAKDLRPNGQGCDPVAIPQRRRPSCRDPETYQLTNAKPTS